MAADEQLDEYIFQPPLTGVNPARVQTLMESAGYDRNVVDNIVEQLLLARQLPAT